MEQGFSENDVINMDMTDPNQQQSSLPTKAEFNELVAAVKAIKEEFKRDKEERQKRKKGPIKCYHCGEVGHVRRHCPKANSLENTEGPSGGTNTRLTPSNRSQMNG